MFLKLFSTSATVVLIATTILGCKPQASNSSDTKFALGGIMSLEYMEKSINSDEPTVIKDCRDYIDKLNKNTVGMYIDINKDKIPIIERCFAKINKKSNYASCMNMTNEYIGKAHLDKAMNSDSRNDSEYLQENIKDPINEYCASKYAPKNIDPYVLCRLNRFGHNARHACNSKGQFEYCPVSENGNTCEPTQEQNKKFDDVYNKLMAQ